MEVEAHRVLYFRIICYLMSSFINHTAFCRFQMFEKSSNDRHFPLCTTASVSTLLKAWQNGASHATVFCLSSYFNSFNPKPTGKFLVA